jgi:hypothetical protein
LPVSPLRAHRPDNRFCRGEFKLATQHFSLSAGSRTLSVKELARISDDEAADLIKQARWPDGPKCPKCSAGGAYTYASRAIWKCKACAHQFSVTSGTIFQAAKLSNHDLIMGIGLFAIGAKGISALRLSHYLDIQYKSALGFCRALRESIFRQQQSVVLNGEVEIDGAYFGGHLRHENSVRDGRRYRQPFTRYENRRVVVVLRQRGGGTLTFVGTKESDALPFISEHIAPGTKIYVDGAQAWGRLAILFATLKINHSNIFSVGDVSTNYAESYFSLLRRCCLGVHHHISGDDLHLYAAETAWRLDTNKRDSRERFYALLKLSFQEQRSAPALPQVA